LKILIYGEDINWSMARNIKIELNKIGIQVDIFDFRDFFLNNKNIIYKVFNKILKKIIFKRINDNFLSIAKKTNYEFILILKGVEIKLSTIKKLKEHDNFLINWSPDHYYNDLNSSNDLKCSLQFYDLIISPRTHLFDFYRSKGVKNLLHIDWYLNASLQYPINHNKVPHYLYDISFIGNWSPKREKYISCLSKYNVKIWGGGWKKASRKFKKNFSISNPIFFPEMSKIINSSKINLNFLTTENKDTSNFRNYELLAAKGFQLSEYSNFLNSQFEEKKHLIFFRDEIELKKQIDYYLKHDQEREQIRNQGYNYSLSNNFLSINFKINQLLNYLNSLK